MAFASLRADYFDRLQADTPLFEAHELVSVAPLTHAGLNEVVTRPPRARRRSLRRRAAPRAHRRGERG
jgi:hypothetical protein